VTAPDDWTALHSRIDAVSNVVYCLGKGVLRFRALLISMERARFSVVRIFSVYESVRLALWARGYALQPTGANANHL